MPAALLSKTKVWPDGKRQISSLALETSMPTSTGSTGPDLEISLPRECELADEVFVASLWRLFGLVPRGRRRSRFSAASEVVPGVSRSDVGRDIEGFSLRFEAFDVASVIEPEVVTL
jgi:hypothetical protein